MPQQAPNSQTNNWRARLKSEFYDQSGRHWRVELIDSDTSSGHTDFGLSSSAVEDMELAGDGFTLSWDGATDHIGGQIIPSSCSVTWIVDDGSMEVLKRAVKKADDSRLALAVYLDTGGTYWEPYWVGALNHEAVEYELQDLPYLFTTVANCGLNRLSNVSFRDSNGETYTDDVSIAEVFARCINEIPTHDFWEFTEYQMREVVDLYSDDIKSFSPSSQGDPYPVSVIERTVVSSLTFSEDGDVESDIFLRRIKQPANFNSCKDVLENIANAFGARITLARFSFWFFPANSLNWTTDSVTVNKWTRTEVSIGDVSTVMTVMDPSGDPYVMNVDRADQETGVNLRVDLDSNYGLGSGWSNSYLLPVKRCTLTFKDAGRRSIFGSSSANYLDYPNNGTGTRNRVNNDIVMSEGDLISFSGVYSAPLVKEFGSALTGTAFDDHGDARIGARILLRFKIKVNTQGGTAYYYKSEYNVETSDHTDIDMPNGFNGDLTDPDIPFHRIFLDSAEWTTSEGFFDIIVPWTNSQPEASVEGSGGWNRVGGLHIEAQQNGEFKYRINSTQWDDVLQSFDFTCLPLPEFLSSYSGIRVDIDRIVLTRDGTVKQTFDDLDHIITTAFIVDYDHNGNDIGSFTNSAPADRIDDFVVTLGSNSDDADWDVFVEQSLNSEFLDCGETTIGSNTVSGVTQSDGGIKLIPHGGTNGIAVANNSPDWNSVTDAIDGLEENTDLQTAMLREQLYQRGKALNTQRGDIFPQVSTAQNHTLPIDILSVIHHNCSSTGDIEEYLAPMALTHNGGSDSYSVEAWMVNRERLSFEHDEGKVSKGKGFGNTGVLGKGPVGSMHLTKFGHTQDQTTELVNADVLRTVFEDQPVKSTTARGALSTATPSSGDSMTWTASNFDGVTTYVCAVTKDSDGTKLLSTSDFTQSGGVVTFNAPSYVGAVTLEVFAVSAGLRRSLVAEFQFTVRASINSYRYLRMTGFNTGLVPTITPMKIIEVQIYSEENLAGTDNPTQAWSSGGVLDFTPQAGTGVTGIAGRAWDNNVRTVFNSTGLTRGNEDQNFLQIAWSSGAGAQPMGSLRVIAIKGRTVHELKVEVSSDGVTWTHWDTLTGFNVGTGQANFDILTKAP